MLYYRKIITNIQKSLGKDSGWIIDSVIDHTISTSKYNLLAVGSYIKLPKELYHPRKGLVNIQNPAYSHAARITKIDKNFQRDLILKNKISSQN